MLPVSVILPTHNRAHLLGEAIGSVLGQTFADLELIVVDDGSTDNTAGVIRHFSADPRLRPVVQANQGRSAARNHGARLASGRWLAFLDSDDRYLNGAIAAHHAAASQNPAAAMTLGGYQYIDEAGRVLGERRPWRETGTSLRDWLFNCLAMPGSVMIQRAWFDRLNGFDPGCEITEDWDLFLRLAQAGAEMAWVEQPVCQYRQHPDNSIHSHVAQTRGAIRTLDKLFSQPNLPTEISQLGNRARAWFYVASAQRALASGRAEAAGLLVEALRFDPRLADDRRGSLIQGLLGTQLPAPGAARLMLPKVVGILPAQVRPAPGQLRRCAARAEMAQFFAHQQRGAPHEQTLAYLAAGLRLNPFWLLNRGVLAYCLRHLLGHARPLQTQP